MEIKFKPIGVVHTKGSDAEVREKGNLEGELEIYPEFEEGLQGIDGYSHLFVLVYFDRLRPEQIGPLQVKPRGLLRRGFKLEELPLLGVFALGFSHAAQSHRTFARASHQTRRKPAFRAGFGLLRRYADSRYQRLPAAISYRQLRHAGLVSHFGRRQRLRLIHPARRFRRIANFNFIFPNSGKIHHLIAEKVVR